MRSGVKVFAWRAIRKCEEITIDYRLNAFSDVRSRCRCGSGNCAGIVQWSFFARDRRFEAGSRRLRGQVNARRASMTSAGSRGGARQLSKVSPSRGPEPRPARGRRRVARP
jgi:hypothetical protein